MFAKFALLVRNSLDANQPIIDEILSVGDIGFKINASILNKDFTKTKIDPLFMLVLLK